MLDAIVAQIKTEIAIEGPKGVSRDKFWDLVQEVVTKVIRDNSNNDTIQPTVDDTYRRFIWPFIVQLPELNYFEDTAQPMNLDPQQSPADITLEQPQEEVEQIEITLEDNTPTASSAKEAPKKRKAPKKQLATQKKLKKKPAARKKKVLDDEDYSSEEFHPDNAAEYEEEASDFNMDSEEENNEGEQEDEENSSAATSKKDGSGNPSQKSVDTSGYLRIDNIRTLSYDEVEQRYGPALRLVAGEDLQNKQIYVGLPPGRPLSGNLKVVLGAIMRTRYSGLTQAEITKELGLDPRSSGHYVKVLAQRGAIIRKSVVVSGSRTNLCVHVRYNHDTLIQKKTTDDQQNSRDLTANGVSFDAKSLRAAIVALLSDTPDNVMYTSDILSALGLNSNNHYVKRWFYRSLDTMCSKNVFRKLRGPRTGARNSRLVQLVDPNQASKERALLSNNSLMEYNPTVDEACQVKGCAGMLLTIKDIKRPIRRGLLYDTPAEPQLLDALYEAGLTGATQKELGYTMRYSDNRSLYKCLERLGAIPKSPNATRFTICRNFEFEGRTRRYRYFTQQAYIKLTEGKDIDLTGPPTPPIKESELIEVDHRKGVSSSKKDGRSTKATKQPRKKPNKQTEPPKLTEEQPTAGTTRSQAQINQAVGVDPNIIEEDAIEASTSETTDTRETPAASTIPSALASIFLPTKRTRSQALDTEENTNESNPINQAADDTADTTELPKRRRQIHSSKFIPKESGSSEQQLITPHVPKGRYAPQVVPMTEEDATVPMETSEPLSATTATVSHKRRNLLDYFTASPHRSPSPVQESRPRDIEALPIVPRSPGPLYQCLVSSLLEENTGVPDGQSTNDTVSDKEIDELFASNIDTNTEDEPQVTNVPNIALDTMDVDVPSNVKTTAPSEAVPILASATAKTVKLSDSKKERQKRVIRTRTGIVTARHITTNDKNAYLFTRKKVLLELLQEQPIIERGKVSLHKFVEKYKATHGDVKMIRGLDTKTFWRSALGLVEDGDAQITTVDTTGLTNKTISKCILVRNDLDLNGPEIKAFKEQYGQSHILNLSRVRVNNFGRFDKSVERLSERLARMEDTHETIKDNSHHEARRLLGDIKQLRSNVEKAQELSEKGEGIKATGHVVMVAIQYGFVLARLIRVKLFHQFLLELLIRGGDGIDQEMRIIQPAAFIKNMPLGLCLQVVGFFQDDARMREFTKNGNNLETRLEDMPGDLKELIMSDKNDFRRHIRGLVEHLLLLKVIGATELDGHPITSTTLPYATSAPAYMLYESVPIIDFWSPDYHVVREYRIETTTDALVYWSDLQYFCTNGGDQRGQVVASSSMAEKLIRALTTVRNWNTAFLFSREQRKILNSYVDKKTGKTPIRRMAACKDIAKRMDAPVAMVINYFKMMERAFKRKLDKPTVQTSEYDVNKKTRRFKGTRMGMSISQAAKNIFKKKENGSTIKRLLKSQKDQESGAKVEQTDPSRELYLDDESLFPAVDESVNINHLRLRRTLTRVKWTTEEDELLIYTFVILKSRAVRNSSRFFWTSVEIVLPNRLGQYCRNRFAKIKVIPKTAEYISSLFKRWDAFYTEGVLTGEIEDNNPYDMLNFDLLGHLAYFIKRIQASIKGSKEKATLPASREELEAKYDVRTGMLEETRVHYYEDYFHNSVSLVQKHDILCDQYFSFRAFELTLLDNVPASLVPEMTKTMRIVQLLMVFIRMILFTPDDSYDPFFAYGVLRHYPQMLSEMAVDRMRSLGQLVRTLPSREQRRIPGYLFGISERYLQKMASGMPNNFHFQAYEYEKHLASHGATKYLPERVSSGMMGCILNLTSIDKLNYSIMFENIEWVKHKIPLYSLRRLDDNKVVNFAFTIEGHDVQEETCRKTETPESQVRVNGLDEASHTGTFLGIHGHQRLEIQPVLMTIKSHLESVKEVGADLIEIKENILAKHPETTDSVIRQCVDILSTASPPLVHRVGFSTYRYVLTTYLGDWVIVSSNVRMPVSNDEIAERAKKLSEIRKEVIDPRIWHDVNGNTTADTVTYGCMVSVLERVLARPGIRERDILRLFKDLLTYVEVKDTLEELVKRGALRKTVTGHTRAPKVTLFSKLRSYSAVDPNTISRDCQTCYWTTPDYYKVLERAAPLNEMIAKQQK